MSTDVNNAFITLYDAEVKEAYQREGSKVRGTIRTRNNVIGSTVRFQKVGKGSASTKARHANVSTMNITHSSVDCSLVDKYAADYVDMLDELKLNIQERRVQARAGAYALGRDTDDQIFTEMDTTTTTVAHATTGLTLPKVLEGWQKLADNDALDGDLWAFVSPEQWTNLLQIQQFADADYIGASDLPFNSKGTSGKKWLGAVWMVHSGLPVATNIRSNFLYNSTSVGHAIAADIKTRIDYVPEKAAHLINSMMSMGAKMIDELGCVNILADET
jgi:hypothetical protein